MKVSVQHPELGRIEVRAVASHEGTTAHVTASRADALQALASERGGLEQALKSSDVVLGSLNANAHGNSPQHSSQGREQGQASAQTHGTEPQAPAAAEIIPGAVMEADNFVPAYSSISVRA